MEAKKKRERRGGKENIRVGKKSKRNNKRTSAHSLSLKETHEEHDALLPR